MVCRCVQLMLPGVHTMQDLIAVFLIDLPPQTTNLPPDKRERLCFILPSGKSGMEQVLVGGGGNISTEGRKKTFCPPTITCPDAKLITDQKEKEKQNF